ncbi:hypothetical protein EW146_g10139 [Bondarzewia mesenterica]|uniref:Oxidase ustYa n=1 Tax=Bondarzewia mesenterica TaxID=1095465 RepID=A0A4S4L4V3_9AGAM|nr:hypothetical protein EW146_g10139 [Bondarzewia mesenterica]
MMMRYCRNLRYNLQHLSHLLFFLGTALLITSALSAASNLEYGPKSVQVQRPLSDYTFIGDDFPAYYPVELPLVSLTPENTIHYQIYSTDAAAEWSSIFPEGGGFLHLGPHNRRFGIALFHQMHCLKRIRQAMSSRKSSEHVHHCFNYLRQSILCDGNPNIEPVIPILGRRSVNAEIPRTCRDWTEVYQIAEENYRLVSRNGSVTGVYV